MAITGMIAIADMMVHAKHCEWHEESHKVSELGSSHNKNAAAAQ